MQYQNHLLHSSSPYLHQHAHNPVDWYPWSPEPLARARQEDKPIFLSIGYAACHWCHVMAHESFENPAIAALLNAHFINIKVDREERPDLDDLYMLATQLMTGQGGWPMSVFLTPTLEPFFAGTYFPPTDMMGRPGFPRLLAALRDAWQNRRPDLLAQAAQVVAAIQLHADESATDSPPAAGTPPASSAQPPAPPTPSPRSQPSPRTAGILPAVERGTSTPSDQDLPPPIENQKWGGAKIENLLMTHHSSLFTLLRSALQHLSDRFDDVNGGLGTAPKFPPHQTLQLFLALLNAPDWKFTGLPISDRGILAHKTSLTLTAMANGGIYDHLAGAFARYSTDEQWLVPHFEKMLYDNAQLAPLYAQASLLFDNPDYARIARETLDFFLREMQSPEGAFYSSLDADSEGHEGQYYVWTLNDIHAALPNPADAALIIHHFALTPTGNWPESPIPGASILATNGTRSVSEGPSHPTADSPHSSLITHHSSLSPLLLALRAHRSLRPRPACDDKILTAWNALMLSALAQTARLLNEPKYLDAAHRLARFLLTHGMPDGQTLLRIPKPTAPQDPAADTIENQKSKIENPTPAFLDDHAFLLNALIDLVECTPPHSSLITHHSSLLSNALALADTLLRDFQDDTHGGFFFTGPHHEHLFARMKNAADNATPSANGIAIRALLRLSQILRQSATTPPNSLLITHHSSLRYEHAALRAVSAFLPHITRHPDYFPTILLALLEHSQIPSSSLPTPSLSPTPVPTPTPSLSPTPLPSPSLTPPPSSPSLLLSSSPLPPLPPSSSFDLTLLLTIPPGFHIQPATPQPGSMPTTLRLRGTQSLLTAQECQFPPPQPIHNTSGYSGQITLHTRCTLLPTAPPGTHTLRATLAAQLCTSDRCLAPTHITLEIPLTITPP